MVDLSKEPVDKIRIVNSLELLRVVVGEHVNLDNKDMGLCPFHEERTGSFHIFKATSGRARYYCHGCGAQGDIFNFMRNMDGLSFAQAMSRLSELLNREIQNKAPFLLPEHLSDSRTSSCEQDCSTYINLREDYESLLEENRALRSVLDMTDFFPSNELARDKKIADWVVNTCLVFGSTTATAYQVAGLFVQGLGLRPSASPSPPSSG